MEQKPTTIVELIMDEASGATIYVRDYSIRRDSGQWVVDCFDTDIGEGTYEAYRGTSESAAVSALLGGDEA